jgi:hypothetical protein
VLTRTMVTARIERVLNDFIRGVTRIEPKTWVPYRGSAVQIGYVSCSQACGPNQGLVPTWLRPVSRPRRPRALPAKWVMTPVRQSSLIDGADGRWRAHLRSGQQPWRRCYRGKPLTQTDK